MKRTYKLRALTGEAAAVIAAAPTLTAAAKQLGVNRSTVHRWIEAGKVPAPAGRARRSLPSLPAARQSPASWARSVRQEFVLDTTEQALVDLAVRALTVARDAKMKPETRLAAMGRFQQIVRQLDFQEVVSGEATTDTAAGTRTWPRRVG